MVQAKTKKKSFFDEDSEDDSDEEQYLNTNSDSNKVCDYTLKVAFDCLFLCQEETSDSDNHTLPSKQKHASPKCSGKKDFDKTSEITHSKSNIDKLSPHVLSTGSPTCCNVTKSTSAAELSAQFATSSGETD